VATSFWAVQLLRRCFRRWGALGPRKRLLALSMWAGNSKTALFWCAQDAPLPPTRSEQTRISA
jgi:hypothetical protein